MNIDDIDDAEQARRIYAVSRDFGWTLAEAGDADADLWRARLDGFADAALRRLGIAWGDQTAAGAGAVVAFGCERGGLGDDDLTRPDRDVALGVLSSLIDSDARSRLSTRALRAQGGPA